ncbi:MAG: type II toxin-antitoxin system prevent-host-death family antitoxin [Sphingomonas sp.]
MTAAELQRQFGRVRSLALREPVIVTNHGREDLVVLSAHEYDRLKRRDRQAIRATEMPEADLALLDSAEIPPEAGAFDHETE